jgi:hypothetical protein
MTGDIGRAYFELPLLQFLPGEQRQAFLENLREKAP